MVAFYNQEDQDIYTGGDHFIPQQQYRLGNFTPTVPTTETQQGYGIPYTNAFTNSNINRDNPNTGGFGDFGNLDESSMKKFNIDGRIVPGYKNLSSGLYQDEQGYNLQNLGLFKDEEDAKYGGLFHNVSLKAILKNPGIVKSFFDRQDVEKQTELDKEIDRANKEATVAARHASGESYSDIGKDMYTGPGQAFEVRKDTYTGGKTIDSASTPGGKYGSPKKDGGRIGLYQGGGPHSDEPQGNKVGGRTDAGPNRTTAYKAGVGSIDESGKLVGKSHQEVHGGGTKDWGKKPYVYVKPVVNLEKRSDLFSDDTEVPVDIGLMARINEARIRANLNLRGVWDAEPEEINSLSDIKGLLHPSIALGTNIEGIDVNAYKDKNIDAYGLRTNIGPLNLGYHDINSQKRGDISYAPNDNFKVGATTDFGDNIDFGATYSPNDWFSVGGTLDDEGKYNVGAELKYTFNNGGLVGLL